MTSCAPIPARHGALRLTEAARPILRGEAGITLRKDTLARGGRRPAAKGAGCRRKGRAASLGAQGQAAARWPRPPACPPMIIFHRPHADRDGRDETPSRSTRWRASRGVGATKLERYGAAFLRNRHRRGRGPVPFPRAARSQGREAGVLYDRLLSVQADLARGDSGLDKPLSCSSSQLCQTGRSAPDRTCETVEKLLWRTPGRPLCRGVSGRFARGGLGRSLNPGHQTRRRIIC